MGFTGERILYWCLEYLPKHRGPEPLLLSQARSYKGLFYKKITLALTNWHYPIEPNWTIQSYTVSLPKHYWFIHWAPRTPTKAGEWWWSGSGPCAFPSSTPCVRFSALQSHFLEKNKKALNVEFPTKTKNAGTKTLLEIISSKRRLIKFDTDSKLSNIRWNPATKKQVSRRRCYHHFHSIHVAPWAIAANTLKSRGRQRWRWVFSVPLELLTESESRTTNTALGRANGYL